MELKDQLQDYTEEEFYRFLEDFFEDTDTNDLSDEEYDKHISKLAEHFTRLVEHPDGNGLIFHPSEDREDSPNGIISEIKAWYQKQGKICFKNQKR
ncbi:bacteriocin immunity protein [Salinivibrio costicola]|uniref:Bacteriocin immunity protein n=1 Tax=Salinivibrio costicola subsp. alcaliphilus TaxID=272773 RepID=A0ABX3KNM9_SALCS|nr:bacteriocin immunity protein [Salinivibrio costicola]OOF32637.1 bacteriocin immunity protein [Salinivibrio costicola subsp. alcaliphilus]